MQATPKGIKSDRVFRVAAPDKARFRVLIVDRDAMGSGLLVDVLTGSLDCEAVATRSNDLKQTLEMGVFDLFIVSADLNMKQGAGFSLANAVARSHPTIPIVIMFDEPSQELTIDAFRSGAKGVFSRQKSKTEFLECIDSVRKGLIWAGREETNFLLEALRSCPAPRTFVDHNLQTLTSRELQVVRSAATGNSNRAIAAELCLSEHTVKNYLFRAFEKLGVSSRVELLFYLTMRGHTFSATKDEYVDPGLSMK